MACARATSGVLAWAIAEAAACRDSDTLFCRDSVLQHSSLLLDQAITLVSLLCVYRLRKHA